MTDARRRFYNLAAWCWPGVAWTGARSSRQEAERADPSEPIMRHGEIRAVRIGARVGDMRDVEPGEAITVKNAYSGRSYGRVVLKQRRVTTEAAALSWISRSPYDVRPHLLLLYYGEVSASLPTCVRYGTTYLAAWCQYCGIGRAWAHAFEPAATDALLRIYNGRDTRGAGRPTIAARASQLRIGDASYTLLVTRMESAFRVRLLEALVEFEKQFTDTELLTPSDCYNIGMGNENAAAFSPIARRAA